MFFTHELAVDIRSEHVCKAKRTYFCVFSDLCKSFGVQILNLLDVEPINDLLTQGRRSRHTKTKNLSQWATREVRKLKNSAANAPIVW